jgi:diguanylate cyclase (GGDEF)-like protein/PAS domain S-box-containing protein
MASIVVIDDRVTNRHILTRLALLVEEGVRVATYEGPLQALSGLAEAEVPDLIVTDFNMPGMDGARFIAALRARRGFADVPIIVVTIYEDLEYRYKALEAGATDFLLSPVDHVEFRARARNLLTLHRQRRLLAEHAAGLERMLAERSPGRAGPADAEVFDRLAFAVSVVDLHGRLQYLNGAHRELFAIEDPDAVGRSLGEVYGEEVATRHALLDRKVIETAQPLDAPRLEEHAGQNGSRSLLLLKSPSLDAGGNVAGVTTLALDITEIHRREQASAVAALHDPGTGLPGLDLFREQARQELAALRRQGRLAALLHVDLDRFKGINDAFGSRFGDQLLLRVAQRLQARLGVGDLVARLGGDEFVVLRGGIQRADDATDLCRRLAEAFATPFVIGRQEVHLSASMGVTVYPADGRTLDALLKNAALAMYRAKASGRDSYRFFAAEMNVAARRAVKLERDLRQALAGDQFVVHYQPQWSVRDRRMFGVEALVRWNHPQRGLVRPGEFIGLAEDIGLIAALTNWVLQTSCQQLRRWRDEAVADLQLSVNLSPVQFRERGVELMIERVLKESGLEPGSLDVELTENAVIDNSQTATASLRYLHQLGVSLSIDDFGTGYSSLSYVKRLPVQRLKIDRSFIQNLEHSKNDEVIVRAIVNLGHSLGLSVIAEGVETAEQLARLEHFRCDQVQGDLLSPAVPAVEIERLMRNAGLGADQRRASG